MTEPATDAGEMQTAHVLLMDMVGYSLLPPADQSRLVTKMQEFVRTTETFAAAQLAAELLVVSSGDGMALAFLRDPAAAALCAIQLATMLRGHGDLPLRMGIHSGLLTRLPDFEGQPTAIGPALNYAQRVMTCGDAGHILLSAEAVRQLPRHGLESTCLEDLGWTRVKHGEPLHLFNLWGVEFGNPKLPARLRVVWPAQEMGGELSPPPGQGQRAADHDRETAASCALPQARFAELEQEGGAVPLDSKFYVPRATDAEFHASLARRDSIILLKGPRQAGKTSLLARGLERISRSGVRVVLTDFQKLGGSDLADPDRFFRALADDITERLGLLTAPFSAWKAYRSASVNFETFLRRQVLGASAASLVWGLDEVDRLFTCPFASQVFGLFRSWHNSRALDPDGPWKRFTMAIAYATEAHLFITDLNQSPFNVGTRLTLEDFGFEEVRELNGRYGGPLRTEADLARFYRLVGGQPFLVRAGLHELVARRWNTTDLELQALGEDGLVGEHLQRLWRLLEPNSDQQEALRAVLRGRPCPTEATFYRLRSAGIVAGTTLAGARPRCQLYALFLDRKLR